MFKYEPQKKPTRKDPMHALSIEKIKKIFFLNPLTQSSCKVMNQEHITKSFFPSFLNNIITFRYQ